MYKLQLINTKKTSSKTRCNQVLSLGGNTFLRGQYFSFAMCLKQIFPEKYNWGALPPLATRLPVKQKFRTWMKILLHYVFG